MLRAAIVGMLVASVAACAGPLGADPAAGTPSPVGTWGDGKWDGSLPVTIEVRADGTATYRWGDYAERGVTAGEVATKVQATGETFMLRPLPGDGVVSCEMNDAGDAAKCTYVDWTGLTTATLKRL